jgi:hypothetical protein
LGQYLTALILLTSITAFFYILFAKRIDVVLLFLFLLPKFVIDDINGINSGDQSTFWSLPLDNYNSVFPLGFLMLSNSFSICLAVPFRLFFNLKRIRNRGLFFIWLIALSLSLGGLIISKIIGIVNPSGLTVGFRIVLSVGALFLPLYINRDEFKKKIDVILFLSSLFFLIGILQGHWNFVLVGFLPYMFLSKVSFNRIIAIPTSILLLIFASTFTILMTFLLSFVLIIVSYILSNNAKKVYLFRYFLFLPLLLTYLFLKISSDDSNADLNGTLTEKLAFKALKDRKPIWDASFDQIKDSFFWFTPSGRPIPIEGFRSGMDEWTPGAHNIFLEVPRQIGNFGGIIIIVIILYYLFSLATSMRFASQADIQIFCSLLAIFIVYGLTGNSLVYDGVGFLFWFLIGQFYHLNNIEYNENIAHFVRR